MSYYRHLKEINLGEAIAIAETLLQRRFSADNGKWKCVQYSELGIEYEGVRVMNRWNDYYVDFDFDPDDISVHNDHNDCEVAIRAELWQKALDKLNTFGLKLSWQNIEF